MLPSEKEEKLRLRPGGLQTDAFFSRAEVVEGVEFLCRHEQRKIDKGSSRVEAA